LLKVVRSGFSTEIYLDNTLVGRVLSNGTTYVTRRRREHYFKKFNGFGISRNVLEKLKSIGVEEVVIIYENRDGTEALLRSDLSSWFSGGISWIDKRNGKEDLQIVLPVIQMRIEGRPDFWRREVYGRKK